jgi:aminoglycoside phosphotransferase (APT) family kinase protein
VTRLVAGEALGQRVVHAPQLAAARALLGAQCAGALAAIHALPLPRAACDMLPQRTAALQLAELAQLHRGFGQALPVFSAALVWLEQHVPQAACTTVVHGDFRTGNLLVDETGLRAVLDWELAHLGDPLEDLGWLCVRSWRFGCNALPVGGFATRQVFFAAYSAAAKREVNPAHVRFWQMLGTLKWGVICQWFAARRLAGEVTGCEPALIGRRVSEVELSLLDLLEGEGA